jgi:SAM-dependent methyltransferase
VAKFTASEYARFRVSYPKILFDGLRSFCGPFSGMRPLRVLDLGSGTGFSSRAFLEFYPDTELTLVEPDAAMLAAAKDLLRDIPRVQYVNASAEEFTFTEAYDLVLVGSAWHWMNRELICQKLEAADVGSVFVFEYQFPKAKAQNELNDWVRREFNLRWKTSSQTPRGTLHELTEGLRRSHSFSEVSRLSIPHENDFDLPGFFGMLISQSRFLAFEMTLLISERDAYRQSTYADLSNFWGLQNEIRFHLPYEGFYFRRRSL